MRIRLVMFVLALSAIAPAAEPQFCQPSAQVAAELKKAAAISIADPFAFTQNVAPFLALRARYPEDLFVHERYQDAVQEHGIEGHLQLLTAEYRALEFKRSRDPMDRYLSLRTMVGRSTFGAIQGLNELLAASPAFAPAHRTLAEIYGAEAFRDAEKEESERKKFLALCPAGTLARRAPSFPDPSPLIDRAESLLAEHGDSDRILALTLQGLRELEWRSQRIRAFDWYSVDYKRRDLRELRAKYWQAWPIEVRCHRAAGRTEKGNELLALMEQRARLLRDEPGSAYREAIETLVRLYAEGKQGEQAARMLHMLEQLPDEDRDATRLEELRKTIAVLTR